jgi:hypothetical protein
MLRVEKYAYRAMGLTAAAMYTDSSQGRITGVRTITLAMVAAVFKV